MNVEPGAISASVLSLALTPLSRARTDALLHGMLSRVGDVRLSRDCLRSLLDAVWPVSVLDWIFG